MKLTYVTSAEILAGLTQVKPHKGDGAGEASIKIAFNLKKLREVVDLAVETRKSVFMELSGGRESIKPDDPVAPEIAKRMTEIDNTEVEVKLWKVKYDSLTPEDVSPDVLNAIMPVLSDVPDLGEPDA